MSLQCALVAQQLRPAAILDCQVSMSPQRAPWLPGLQVLD